jgi:homoaconitase/3-isopropylmalate dehydratase large subunit
LLLSKTEIKLICSIGLPKWQEKKLQKLSVEKLKENGLVWVPKRRIQVQKDDAQASVATKAKERRRFKKNCQVRGLHQIIKIIGHGIIHTLCLCLYGIHPLVCIVISQLLILIIGMDRYASEGC